MSGLYSICLKLRALKILFPWGGGGKDEKIWVATLPFANFESVSKSHVTTGFDQWNLYMVCDAPADIKLKITVHKHSVPRSKLESQNIPHTKHCVQIGPYTLKDFEISSKLVFLLRTSVNWNCWRYSVCRIILLDTLYTRQKNENISCFKTDPSVWSYRNAYEVKGRQIFMLTQYSRKSRTAWKPFLDYSRWISDNRFPNFRPREPYSFFVVFPSIICSIYGYRVIMELKTTSCRNSV